MAKIYVSNNSELTAALSSAKGGDQILLEPGKYGSIKLSNLNFDSFVTLRSADPDNEAVLGYTDIENSSYIRLDDLVVDNSGSRQVDISNSNNIEVLNSEVRGEGPVPNTFGILVTNGSNNVTLTNNYVHNVDVGITILGGSDHTINENYVDYVYSDYFKFSVVQDILIENNTGGGNTFPGPEVHTDFIQFQGSSSDIVIRGNVFLAQNSERPQGIFLGKHVYDNVLIEQNIIYSGKVNAIKVFDGSNIVVRDNTLLSTPDVGHDVAVVSVPSGSVVENNIYTHTSGGFSGSNVIAQWDDPNDINHYSDLFVNAEVGLGGITLEDLRPVEGSLTETKGAYDRLMELLTGTPYTPEPYVPSPTDLTPTEADTATDPIPTEPDTGRDQGQINLEPINGTQFSMLGTQAFTTSSDVIEVAHSADLALDSATISLSFSADSVSGRLGLLSKDASGYSGGGNHFSVYIENGSLIARFQDGTGDSIASIPGIEVGRAYDLQLSFGNNTVAVWLDGQQVWSGVSAMSWVDNTEHMQIGALGWASETGKAGYGSVFDGTISDVVVAEGKLEPQRILEFIANSADTGTDSGTETGTDSGTDTGTDIGTDTGTDIGSGTDTGTGTGTDTGTITVSNRADLISALDNASGGEVIVLQNGDYGSLSLSGLKPASSVTIRAETALGATFTALSIDGSSNIEIDGIHVDSPTAGARFSALVDILGSTNISLVNSEINAPEGTYDGAYGLRVTGNSTEISIANNYIHDVRDGAVFFSTSGLEVLSNKFQSVGGDTMKFGGVQNTLIEGNLGATIYTHPDTAVHNDFIQFQGDSSGVEIRGNIMLLEESPRDNTAVVQGIFIKDGVYSDFKIEQNIIHTNTVNGIFVRSDVGTGANFDIVNNTVLSTTDIAKWDNALIRIVSLDGSYRVEGNIVDGIDDQVKTGAVTNNLVLQWEDPSQPNHYNDVYATVGASGATIADFMPVDGGPASGPDALGASEWIDLHWIDMHLGESTGDTGTTDQTDYGGIGTTDQTDNGGTVTGDESSTGNIVFELNEAEFNGFKNSITNLDHDTAFELTEGTIAFTFNADVLRGLQGLMSKDATNYVGGGNHVSMWLEGEELFFRFQDEDSDAIFTVQNIVANKDYDVQTWFGNGEIGVAVNGELIGIEKFNLDLNFNQQNLQIGGLGWASKDGGDNVRHAFDGTISEMTIVDQVPSLDIIDLLL
jgi:hypothetical protein